MFAVSAAPWPPPPRASHRAAAAPFRGVVTVRAQAKATDAKDDVSRREAVIGAAAASVALLSASPARALDVGATAPGFTLPSTGGGSVTLADVVKDNKYTVLYFYNQAGSYQSIDSSRAPRPSTVPTRIPRKQQKHPTHESSTS